MGIFKKAYKFVKRVFGGRRKKRVVRRRRTAKKMANRPITVVKHVILDRVSQLCNASSMNTMTFQLADINQYASYVALYDKFKIVKVVVALKQLANSSTVYSAPGQITTAGFVHSIIDTTDSNISGYTINNFLNDTTYKVTRSTRDHVRTIYPKYQNNIAGDVQAQSISGWLNTKYVNDSSINTVSHYGLKYLLDGGQAASPGYTSFIFEPILTYTLMFKDPK